MRCIKESVGFERPLKALISRNRSTCFKRSVRGVLYVEVLTNVFFKISPLRVF